MDFVVMENYGESGEIVNGVDNFVWNERYLKNGEFKINVEPSVVLLDQLAMGRYLTHTDTTEFMLIEDHEITESRGIQTKLAITGRTFDSVLERRLAVPNALGLRDRATDTVRNYDIPQANSWDQAKILIDQHLSGPTGGYLLTGDTDYVVDCVVEVPDTEIPQFYRVIERGSLYERVLELLSVGGCGIKSRRVDVASGIRFILVIHNGYDLSDQVVFSSENGDLDEVTYLNSIRDDKNVAFVCGKYDGHIEYGDITPAGLGRNWVYVNASDIEDNTDPTAYAEQFRARGKEALSKNQPTSIVDTSVSPDSRYVYGRDYQMGDIITVLTRYGTSSKMRVTGYTLTGDVNGTYGFPTLEKVE